MPCPICGRGYSRTPVRNSGFNLNGGRLAIDRLLVVIGKHVYKRFTGLCYVHLKFYRPTANLAVLDVILLRNRTIDDHGNGFAAIRTVNGLFAGFQPVQSQSPCVSVSEKPVIEPAVVQQFTGELFRHLSLLLLESLVLLAPGRHEEYWQLHDCLRGRRIHT